MRVSMVSYGLVTVVMALGAPGSAQAADYWAPDGFFVGQNAVSYAPDDTVRIQAGIGAMYLQGDEKVVSGNNTISHLIWQTKTPVLRGSIAVDFGGGLSASLEGSTAGFGTSYMEDYDWLRGNYAFDNWSDRSQHPDTRLNHYFTGAAALGYELVNHDNAVVRVHGGFKYTDVKWTAHGGTFVYSGLGFRDTTGSFADGVPGITYRQQLPELFLGFDGEEDYGSFRVGGLLRGGVTFFSTATDDHWLRNLRFVDSLYMAPTFTAGVDIGFDIGRNAEFILAARYDHIFEQRGDTRYYDIPTGVQIGGATNAAAGALRSAELTAALKGSF
ncbi:omptin family outer membrane protease [Devosia oryziradicis]|uniref:Omptin family outer membrane protease n=1 Tax=Devosia oryziradicis TaxID=2801335 RepID=A0ABX7BXN0_9HYPH|nr:omptin family outer membrane protease [Devosia oryziradicis]QQR36709.1 omptin family outer membrane protease [Devosia oryziradicis]